MGTLTWDNAITDAVAGDFSTCYVLLRKSGTPNSAREITLQGVLAAAADGSASAPGFAFGADTNTGIYRITTDKIGVTTAGTLRLSVLADGKIGIGTTNPVRELQVYGSSNARIVCSTDDRNDGFFVTPALAMYATSSNVFLGTASNHDLRMGTNSGASLVLAAGGGSIYSETDNNTDLGSASKRFKVVYAGTGTINTSDERDKHWRGALTDAELAAARAIAAEIGLFQWHDAVAEKGADAARLHVGVRAQRIWAIMADHGLVDPIGKDGRPSGRCGYAFLCYDDWPESVVDHPVFSKDVTDADGRPAVECYRPAAIPGGDRYGVRPDQLALFLLAAQEQRLVALEGAA